MNPNTLPIPHLDPLPLTAPAGLMWFLLILTFFLHLLPMNFVLGGSVIAALARLRGSHPHARKLAHWFAKAMPVTIAAAVSLGVAPLLFVQALYGRLFFTGSVIMGWFWFSVIPLLILAYYGAYILSFKDEKLGVAAIPLAWLIAAIFIEIGFLYTNNMTLMLRPEILAQKYAQGGAGLQLNLDDPTVWPRYLHMFFGALAVSGMAVAHYGLFRREDDPEFSKWAIGHGSMWFVVPTVINMFMGIWWLAALPKDVIMEFMGQNALGTASLMLGVALGLGSVLLMAVAPKAENPALSLRGAGAALVLTLVTMTLARDGVRQGALTHAGFTLNPWVQPQWSIIGIFALLLVIAIATIVWMVTVFVRSGSLEADQQDPSGAARAQREHATEKSASSRKMRV